jgi:hypothetical protein
VCFKIEGEGSVITPSFKGGGVYFTQIFLKKMSVTHEEDSHGGDNLFYTELVYGSSAIVAIVIFVVLYIVIKNYFDRRARDAAQRELDEAQRARDAAYKQARYEAQRERSQCQHMTHLTLLNFIKMNV